MQDLADLRRRLKAYEARRHSADERLARARGDYEREGSDRNYLAMLEAETAWLRLQNEVQDAELSGWRRIFRTVIGRVKAARNEAAAAG